MGLFADDRVRGQHVQMPHTLVARASERARALAPAYGRLVAFR
jgi:hypothetical protein